MTDYTSPQVTNEADVASFFSTIAAEKEAQDVVMAGKPSPTSMFSLQGAEAMARTYITGYTTAEEAPSYLNRLEAENAVDDITIEDKHQMLKDSGVKVEYINNFENMNNRELLGMEIARHKKFIEAEDTISRMPITEQVVGGVVASIGDPVGLAAGIGVGKVFTGINSMLKMSKIASTALLTAENAIAAGTAVGVSEYMIRKENNTQDQEKLESAIGFGAAFGAGITLLPTAFIGATSIASQAVAATGIKNMMNYKDGNIKRFLTFNATDSVKLSTTAPDGMKMDAEKAVTSVHGTVDTAGNKVVSEGDTAMGYVSEMVNGVLTKVRLEQNKQAMGKNTSMDDISVTHKQEYNKWETLVGDTVDNTQVRILKTEGEAGIHKLYTQATGQELKVDAKGKVKEPVDLYQVVSNYLKKELEASGTLKIPEHLKYIHDAYTKYAEEGNTIGKSGLAGKTAFGYAPHTWNDSAIRSRPKDEVVGHIVEMLKNNPLVKHEYELAAGNKKAISKLDKEYLTAAEKKYQDAIEVDMMKTFEGHTSSSDTPRSSKLRKLRVDTSLYPEYFANNVYAELESYAHQMAGQLAMKKYYGIESDTTSSINKKLTDLKLKYMQEGATTKDLENWEAMMQSILGTRQIKREHKGWTSYLGTMLPKTASALWSSGFSVLSLGEVGVVMAKQGVIPTLKAFIPAHKAHLDMIRGMDKNNPNLQYYLDMGAAGMTLRDARHSKFENETRSNQYYAGEKALDSINHFGRKITFFSHIQDTLDHMAGSAYMNDLYSVMKSGVMSDAQKSKFMRHGLSEADIGKLNNAEWIREGGKITGYNFYNWTDKDLAKRVHNSLRNAVEDTIVRTDGTRIHRAQSDVNDFVKALYLQYTNFPMAAYERLLVNFDEVTARTMAGAMASFAISYSVQELNDAAKVAAGIKDRRASVETLALKSFLNTPFSTIFPTIYDNASSIVGMTSSKGFTPREGSVPTSAGGSALQGMARHISKGGRNLMEGEYAEAFANISKVFPIANNIPILNLAFKVAVGQTEKEHNGYRDMTDMSKDPAIARIFKGTQEDDTSYGGLALGAAALGASVIAGKNLMKKGRPTTTNGSATTIIKETPTSKTVVETNAPDMINQSPEFIYHPSGYQFKTKTSTENRVLMYKELFPNEQDVISGQTATDVFNIVKKYTEVPEYKTILDKIEGTIKQIDVTRNDYMVSKPTSLGEVGGVMHQGETGTKMGFQYLAFNLDRFKENYGAATGAIQNIEQTVMHELVHNATLHHLYNFQNSPEAGRFLKDIKDLLKGTADVRNLTAAPERNRYGLTNEREFVAEALTRPEFIMELKQVKLGELTAYDKFINAIKRLFGFTEKETNAYAKTLEAFNQIMDISSINKVENITHSSGQQYKVVDVSYNKPYKPVKMDRRLLKGIKNEYN